MSSVFGDRLGLGGPDAGPSDPSLPASLIEDARRLGGRSFSELDLGRIFRPGSGGRAASGRWDRPFDNSPFAAGDPDRAARPALVATGSGARAATSLARASRIRIGGFCNFSAVLAALRDEAEVLIAPADVWLGPIPQHGVEDLDCAQAFAEALADPAKARPALHLRRVRESETPAHFRKFRPKDLGRDLDLCLGIDTIPVVPAIRVENGVGILI